MGYNYSYHLYISREHVWRMLHALGQQAFPDGTEHTMVYLPGGEVIDVPFTSGFKTDPVWYSEQTSTLEFDVSLWLQVDEDERKLFQEDDWNLDEQGMVRFGSLYLTIDFRPEKLGRLMSFRFDAATDGMSDLMSILDHYDEHSVICWPKAEAFAAFWS